MAHKHIEHKAMIKPCPGVFSLYIKIDFSIPRNKLAAAADYLVCAKILKNWVLLDSYWKMPADSTSTATLDIGTTYDGSGQEIAAGVDVDAGSQTGWTQGTIKSGALEIVDADSYVTVETLGAAISDGILEILLLVATGVDESSPADNVAVTA